MSRAEARARKAWEEEFQGSQEAAEWHDRRAYEGWSERRRQDGEDSSEEAYMEHLESMMPDD